MEEWEIWDFAGVEPATVNLKGYCSTIELKISK